MNIDKIVDLMAMIGIPSIFTIVVYLIRICAKYAHQINILMRSQQAQMRTKLLELYSKYIERGYITDDELQDWENQYQAYHDLGKNGILDARRAQLLTLPNTKPTKTKKEE